MAGAILDPFVVTMDHEQRRVKNDRLVLFAQASREGQQGIRVTGLDPILTSSDIWQNPVTWDILLRPQPTTVAWSTSNSGANAKLAKASFTLSGSAGDWEDRIDQQAAGPWIGLKDSASSGTGLTTATYSKNRAFSLAFFTFARGQKVEVGRCGWHSSAAITGGVGLIIWSDGTADVYKGGVWVGTGTVMPSSAPGGQNLTTLHLLLIPGRRRELTIVSSVQGGGFSHVFTDIDEDDPDPEITPAGKFWFQLNAGASHVQVAPMVFATSGYAIFPVSTFAEAPGSTRTSFESAYYDESFIGGETVTASMREAAAIGTVFAPNGVKTTARLRVDLAGGGTSSPFLYGSTGGFLAEYDVTDDSESVNLQALARGLKITVPDSNSGAQFSFGVKNPAASTIQQWDILSNRPCLLSVGTCTVIDGRTRPPRYRIRPNEASQEAFWEVADPWEALRRYQFRERVVLNGADLKATLEAIVELATGLATASMDISPDPAITISPAPAPVAGEWSNIIEVGDTADKVLVRLFNAYLGGWFYGFVPGLTGCEFKARPPVTVASAADVTIYDNHEDAIAALVTEGMSTSMARLWSSQRVAHDIEFYSMAPEATEVRVTGFDPRDRRPLQAFYRDSAAEDPTLAPSLRGANWQGERAGYGLLEPKLDTQDLTNDAATALGDTLTRVRTFCQFTSGVLFHSDGRPIWRGDVVELSTYGKFRVRSADLTSSKEPVSSVATGRDGWVARRGAYLVEKMTGTEAPWGAHTGARSIEDLSSRLFWQFQGYSNPFKAVNYLG